MATALKKGPPLCLTSIDCQLSWGHYEPSPIHGKMLMAQFCVGLMQINTVKETHKDNGHVIFRDTLLWHISPSCGSYILSTSFGVDVDVVFRVEHSTVTYSQNVDQAKVSTLTIALLQ